MDISVTKILEYVPWQFWLSVTNYQVNVLFNLFRKTWLTHTISFFYDLSICCLAQGILSWKFADLWQSLGPMLYSVYLQKLKSTMKMWIFYCVSLCLLTLDFKSLLSEVVNFLIKRMYGTVGISSLIFDKIMFLKLFVSLN